MDQAKTGRFIAARRKELGLTQRQLAEQLSISDKTVSKWECGGGLPEVGLVLPLCGALFVPTMAEYVKGYRTFTRRKLTSPERGRRGMCRHRVVRWAKEKGGSRRGAALFFAVQDAFSNWLLYRSA